MLKRKTTASSAARSRQHSGGRKTEGENRSGAAAFCHYQQRAAERGQAGGSEWKIQNARRFPSRRGKLPANGQPNAAAPAPAQSTVDLTETIKTLLHLAQEHGYVTYDDINDVLPDNLSPDDLDALLTKLRSLDVEIVMDQAEAERAERTKQPEQAQPEEADEDARLEILDDPVRMYMNQMGKVPLLTREQEVEICKKIEEAEVAMKTHRLQPRFHGQGTHRHRGKTAVRAAQGAL